jgi:hypothetical protein
MARYETFFRWTEPLWRHRVRRLHFVNLRLLHRRHHMPTIVTGITLTPGASTPVEIGVQDQSGDALLPGDISWVLSSPVSAVVIASDADGKGFDFTAPSGMSDASGTATATFALNGVSVSAVLNVSVVEAVTALQFVTLSVPTGTTTAGPTVTPAA